MKTISKLILTDNRKQNAIALTGLLIVTALIVSFTFLAITNGIKPF